MPPLAAYQSACQPQSPPPVQSRTKDGDSLKVCTSLCMIRDFVVLICKIKLG